MADKRFDDSLREFIAEIGELDLPAFVETHRWRLHEDIQNGVAIGYDLGSPSDRKILYHIGRRRCVPAMWWICRCPMAA